MTTHTRWTRAAPRNKATVSGLSIALASAMVGCSAARPGGETVAQSLTAHDVIQRCAGVYSAADSVRARGRLVDRRGSGGEKPFEWEYSRPGKVRLRVAERVAIVRDGRWYHYDPARDVFREHPGLGGDPMNTAVYFLAEGAPMPTVALPERGRAALESGVASAWRIVGLRWVSDRPCYAVRQPFEFRDRALAMTLWIDQDSFLVRGWVVAPADADADEDEEALLQCEYESIELDTPIRAERFAIGPERSRLVARADSGLRR